MLTKLQKHLQLYHSRSVQVALINIFRMTKDKMYEMKLYNLIIKLMKYFPYLSSGGQPPAIVPDPSDQLCLHQFKAQR